MNNPNKIKMVSIILAVLVSAPIMNRVGKLVKDVTKKSGTKTTMALAESSSKTRPSAIKAFLNQEGISNGLKQDAQRAQLIMAMYENKTNKNMANAKKLMATKSSENRKAIRFEMAVESLKWVVLATMGFVLFSQLKKIVTFKDLQNMLKESLDLQIAQSKKNEGYWGKLKSTVTTMNPINTFMLRLTNIALQSVTAVTGFGVDLGMVLYYLTMVTALFFRKITSGRKVSVGLTGVSFENVSRRKNNNIQLRIQDKKNKTFNSLMKTIGTSSSSNSRLLQM